MVQCNVQLFDSLNDIGDFFSLLDDMTNKGLYHFAQILTGGSITFEKTRWKMKKIIKVCLPKVLGNQNDNDHMNTFRKLYSLVKDPNNFRGNRATLLTTASQSYHTAAIKLLDGLEDLPTQTLSAMHRKLRGIQGYVPELHPPKSGWGRNILIDCLRKSCTEMLSKLGEGDELQEPLANALAVGGLTLKQLLGCHFVTEFKQFSPEIEILQNEIAKAIWLLNEVKFPELKNLQLLLDPRAELSNRSLRIAIKKLLTEYLFECSDMDTIPECLLETLGILNQNSQSAPYRLYFCKKEIEEEVECILSVSAQTKLFVWDLIPENEFDQGFADAYMEDLEESDDGDMYDYDELQMELPKNSRFDFNDLDDQIESIGETNPIISMTPAAATKVCGIGETNESNSKSPASTNKGDGCSPVLTPKWRLNNKLESMHSAQMDSVASYGFASSSSCLESKILDSPQCMDGNQYQSGSMRNLGLTYSHPHNLTANRTGYAPNFYPDGISNGSYCERQEHTIDSAKPPHFVSFDFSCGEANILHDKQSITRNQYLAIQDASDETSMLAYRVIGHLLNEFAQIEELELDLEDVRYLKGYDPVRKNSEVAKEDLTSFEEKVRGSAIIRVVEELIPSFPESGKEALKELLGLR